MQGKANPSRVAIKLLQGIANCNSLHCRWAKNVKWREERWRTKQQQKRMVKKFASVAACAPKSLIYDSRHTEEPLNQYTDTACVCVPAAGVCVRRACVCVCVRVCVCGEDTHDRHAGTRANHFGGNALACPASLPAFLLQRIIKNFKIYYMSPANISL